MWKNNWDAIRAHYAKFAPKILAHRKDEWAIDPYAWDEGKGMIQMTPIEYNFWADAREANAILYPQWPACGYFLDFANPRAMVAIECDGAAYHRDKQADAKRQAVLETAGWCIYRISGRDCNTDFNEETRAASPSRKLMDRICAAHDISRTSPSTQTRRIGEVLKQRYDRGGQ